MKEERPIIALDFSSFEETKAFLDLFPAEEKLYVKIGMELYYAQGPDIVRSIKSLGHNVFLDLNYMIFQILFVLLWQFLKN